MFGAVGFKRQIVVAVQFVIMELTVSFVELKYMLFPLMCFSYSLSHSVAYLFEQSSIQVPSCADIKLKTYST